MARCRGCNNALPGSPSWEQLEIVRDACFLIRFHGEVTNSTGTSFKRIFKLSPIYYALVDGALQGDANIPQSTTTIFNTDLGSQEITSDSNVHTCIWYKEVW